MAHLVLLLRAGNEHTSPRPLESLSGASESLSGRGFREPDLLKRGVALRVWELRGQRKKRQHCKNLLKPLRDPKTSGPLRRVLPLAFLSLGPQLPLDSGWIFRLQNFRERVVAAYQQKLVCKLFCTFRRHFRVGNLRCFGATEKV